jgi:hypothetical protein
VAGMICTLNNRPNYGVICTKSSGDLRTDRRTIINMCARGTAMYRCLLGVNMSVDKPNSLSVYRLTDPLETLGVEYIFSLFILSRELSVSPETLTYAYHCDSSINIVFLSP